MSKSRELFVLAQKVAGVDNATLGDIQVAHFIATQANTAAIVEIHNGADLSDWNQPKETA
ncbi:hypothetical protein CJ179_38680 [Rhodococcus sp. ACS1]|uniref:hypothetical protein n=1 Tax=Rhodococcus sp. ACS1 TaxID=2028570 RepID=UPI000BB156A8|nr:hypothetical protein [Rhodococcus sp. ACS1]PBC38527.1 hypothetical protein CJ179_38680 [Rhodococcus sp. ACS1]